jgi:hypothetical protein
MIFISNNPVIYIPNLQSDLKLNLAFFEKNQLVIFQMNILVFFWNSIVESLIIDIFGHGWSGRSLRL